MVHLIPSLCQPDRHVSFRAYPVVTQTKSNCLFQGAKWGADQVSDARRPARGRFYHESSLKVEHIA